MNIELSAISAVNLRREQIPSAWLCLDVVRLKLRPFDRTQLHLVEPWFDDPDTTRWLGDRNWPRQMLDLADRPLGEFRGANETGSYRWLAWQQDQLVGYIDCGTFDRWTTWEGGPDRTGVVSAIPVPSGAIAFVVNPLLRGRGHCTEMINALTKLPDLAHIEVFAAGVEPENTASVGCLIAAGFAPADAQPDWEGIVYYLRSRSAT